jgi:hypothetical protein
MEIEEGNVEVDELNLGFWLVQKKIIVLDAKEKVVY